MVLFKIKDLEMAILKIMATDPYIKKYNITPVQISIIKYLYNKKIVYQKDIEKILKIRRSTISGILHTMEKNGLIIKKDNNIDARSKQILLTDLSIKLYGYLFNKMNMVNEKLCLGIDSKDLNLFYNIIDKMLENIKEDL